MAGGTSSMAEPSDPTLEALHEQLVAYMERKGLRSTSQRRLVSEVFFRTGGHLSIDDMLALVRKQDPKVGYATVYRTLKLLVECGLANERQFDDTVTRFEVAHHDSHHDHLICLECKKIVEFEDSQIERLQDALAKRHGFRLVSHKHELYGLCGDCQGGKGAGRRPIPTE
ncbi:MAG: Fur family transcriptional regulator [Polyangiales bacterium]